MHYITVKFSITYWFCVKYAGNKYAVMYNYRFHKYAAFLISKLRILVIIFKIKLFCRLAFKTDFTTLQKKSVENSNIFFRNCIVNFAHEKFREIIKIKRHAVNCQYDSCMFSIFTAVKKSLYIIRYYCKTRPVRIYICVTMNNLYIIGTDNFS